MDSTTSPASNLGSIARTITKILRFRRSATGKPSSDQDDYKLKPLKIIEEFPTFTAKSEDEKQPQEASCSNREATESLLANLFASISAVKASYAQLQFAQSPYDPETIQSADQALVSELKHLSELKQSYFDNQPALPPPPPLAAQVQEHKNIIKTYQITTRKLESDLKVRDSEISALQGRLTEFDRTNRSMESKLLLGRSLSCLDDLHISRLDSTHFLAVLRHAVKAVRSFVRLMVSEMESAGWDLNAAASSIQLDIHQKPGHRNFAFESFVSDRMFSGFHLCDFGLDSLEERASWGQQQLFDEFTELKTVKLKHILNQKGGKGSSFFGKFCRAKYLGLVHPKMEASFFGDLDQRGIVSSGRGFPDSEFFAGFAEMARRVWLLHCLFFSFGKEMDGSIFQVRRGSRFSEVYMESVVEGREVDADTNAGRPTVGFTVVPGFRVGRTVIQCKVYPSINGRP